MQTLPLGHTGVNVSAFCLGAMYFGTRNDAATSYRLLDMYVDAGGTFIDTANIYAWWVPGFQGGESETLLGEWLRARRHRDRLFIASKVGFQYGDVTIGLTAAQIEAECDKSLRRMGIETIDLFYAHVDDRNTPLEETLGAFDRLGAGRQGALHRRQQLPGLAAGRGRRAEQGQRLARLLLRPTAPYLSAPQARRHPSTPSWRSTTISWTTAAPRARPCWPTRPCSPAPTHGLTAPSTQRYLGADADARLAALRQVAAAHNVTPNQVILAWLLQGDPAIIPVMAAGSEAQMQENLAALALRLTGDEVALLTRAGGA